MRKILLLALGGTIACVKTRRGFVPKLKARDLLMAVSFPRGIIVDGNDFLKRTILFPQDWVLLSREIFSLFHNYDGFVVTLGTDTLAFVASALSLMLRNLSKPVVLTGSMKPIGLKQSDGRRNLSDAIRIATVKDTGGVFVVFDGNIFDGSVVSKVHSESRDAFESINVAPLGNVAQSRIQWQKKPQCQKGELQLRDKIDTRVITVKLTPQTDANFFKSIVSYRGIIIEGYGDGNVPSNIVPAISHLAKKRAVILASQCAYGGVRHQYEGGSALIKNGALSSYNMTKETASVKLMQLLGQTKDLDIIRRLWNKKTN